MHEHKNGMRKKPNHVEGRLPSYSACPKISIDWILVKKLCMMQCTLNEICAFLEINRLTMYKACNEVFGVNPSQKFAEWREGGNCSLRRKQWNLAETNASMAIFLGKQYLGQSEDYNVNQQGSVIQVINYGDKKDVQQEPLVDDADISDIEDETTEEEFIDLD